MRLLALDAATRTGYATGTAGQKPRVGAVRLKKPEEPVQVAWENIGFFLKDMFVLDKPDLIAIEAPMHPAGQKSPDAVVLQWGVVAVVTFMAKAYDIALREVNAQTVSRHFTGKSRWAAAEGGRKAKKAAAVQRAQVLGYIPADCRDEDMADACAVFDYASHTFARVRAPERLVLFGEQAA
jgi:hypothetical protein